MQVAFKLFDKEGTGLIDKNQLKYVMEVLGEKLTDEEAEEMIKESDLDNDGFINFEEFSRLM